MNTIPINLNCALGITTVKTSLRESINRSTFASRFAEKASLDYAYFKDKSKPSTNDLIILGNFQEALYNDELYLVYQPQIDTATKKVIGVEALVRWDSKVLGTLKPRNFVPLVEQAHLIFELTAAVIKTAFETQHMLLQNYVSIKMSINISVKNLLSQHFFIDLSNWLKTYNIPSKSIEFEITEHGIMSDSERSMDTFDKMDKEQIKISIDDFGTGYSSLSHLQTLPIKTLKIDKYFINIEPLAECVETTAQVELLKSLNCNLMQGYSFAEPMRLKHSKYGFKKMKIMSLKTDCFMV